VFEPELAKGLPLWQSSFLYTNSPGQLHYTFAYFQCGNTCEEQIAERPGEGRTGSGGCGPRIPASNFKSNRT